MCMYCLWGWYLLLFSFPTIKDERKTMLTIRQRWDVLNGKDRFSDRERKRECVWICGNVFVWSSREIYEFSFSLFIKHVLFFFGEMKMKTIDRKTKRKWNTWHSAKRMTTTNHLVHIFIKPPDGKCKKKHFPKVLLYILFQLCRSPILHADYVHISMSMCWSNRQMLVVCVWVFQVVVVFCCHKFFRSSLIWEETFFFDFVCFLDFLFLLLLIIWVWMMFGSWMVDI